jgi:hypothetical protein
MAAYADGTIRAWDVLTKTNRYDLKGRSSHIRFFLYIYIYVNTNIYNIFICIYIYMFIYSIYVYIYIRTYENKSI